MVVAMTEDRVIGRNNQLIWHLPNDLKHFKTLTMGKPIIMGRKTQESIGRPLPGRRNIVLSRQKDLKIEGCEVAHSVEEVLVMTHDAPEIMIVGGEKIYQSFFDLTDTIYLTLVHTKLPGDAHFMAIDEPLWQVVSREDHSRDEKHAYDYTFITYEKCV